MKKKVEEMKKARQFYYSTAWRRCRTAILGRDNHLCQSCLKKGILTSATTVHHIKPLDDYPELALDADNLESCCRQCHEEHHPEHGFVQMKRQIKVVIGYPGPDKTKWAKQMMQEHDVLMDQDAIAKAINSNEIAEDMIRDAIRNIRGKGYSFNIMYIVREHLTEEEEQLLRAARAQFYWMEAQPQGDKTESDRWRERTRVRVTHIPPPAKRLSK